tara:strand:- start:3891 stop:4202 length:312 start_codon:yes stop_codon:yes gene_type:complete
MQLVEFLLFILGYSGLTVLLTRSEILDFFREWINSASEKLGYLVSCPMCSGFWIGLLAGHCYDYGALVSAGAISLASWVTVNSVEALYAIGVYFDENIENGDE